MAAVDAVAGGRLILDRRWGGECTAHEAVDADQVVLAHVILTTIASEVRVRQFNVAQLAVVVWKRTKIVSVIWQCIEV